MGLSFQIWIFFYIPFLIKFLKLLIINSACVVFSDVKYEYDKQEYK